MAAIVNTQMPYPTQMEKNSGPKCCQFMTIKIYLLNNNSNFYN